MRRTYLILIVTLLFLAEGTFLQLLVPDSIRSMFWISPHLTLTAIIFISLYLGSKDGLWFGIAFGALYDLIFGSIWGLFLFLYALIGNSMGLLITVLHRNIWLILTAAGVGSIALDTIHYGFYRMFRFTTDSFPFVFFTQIVPSSLVNTLFVLVLYPILHPLLTAILQEREEGDGGK